MRISLLLASLLVAPASAQSLPEWARPSEPVNPYGPESADGPFAQAAPDPPPVPVAPVPLDGGLGLLALAGGAYAVRRLRTSE